MKKTCMIWGIIFCILGVIFCFIGFGKKNIYENGDYSHTNAYVGGDAYNYIINGTYFTGYEALGGLLLVCGSIFFIGSGIAEKMDKIETNKQKENNSTKNLIDDEAIKGSLSDNSKTVEEVTILEKKLQVQLSNESISGINVINAFINKYLENDGIKKYSLNLGGLVTTNEKIDGVYCSINGSDIFGDNIINQKNSFVDIQMNGNAFLTESISLNLDEHDVQRLEYIQITVINYSRNGKKVLSYSKN